MSKESYARGFCKVAEAAGVDPSALAKYAQSITGHVEHYMTTPESSTAYRIANSFKDYVNGVRSRIDMMNKRKAEHEKRLAFLRGYDKAEPAWVSYTIGPGARGPDRPAKGAIIQPWYKERSHNPSMKELEDDFNEWNRKRNEILESYGRPTASDMSNGTGAASRVSAPISKK